MNDRIFDFKTVIDRHADRIQTLTNAIFHHPELGLQEHFAAGEITGFLRQCGFEVESPFGGLPTAFRASFGAAASPHVAVLAEYDALAGIGHACGHNLISASALGTFLAVAEAIRAGALKGRISIIGTPGEESFGGKVQMLRSGAFEKLDMAIISHPFRTWGVDPGDLAVTRFDVRFFGRAAHAAAAPEDGLNALDAMNLFYAGIACWRQQMPKGVMVHGFVADGGKAPNIIPDRTRACYYLRSTDNATIRIAAERFVRIARGAAMMTGCRARILPWLEPYAANRPNAALENFVRELIQAREPDAAQEIPERISTDFGDVSLQVPGVNLFFGISGGKKVALHSEEFKKLAATPGAFASAMRGAEVMSSTLAAFLSDGEFRKKVKKDFETPSRP